MAANNSERNSSATVFHTSVRWRVQFCAVAIASLVVEGMLLLLLDNHSIPIVLGVAAHLGLVSSLGIWSTLGRSTGGDKRLSLLLTLTTLMLGPFGALGTLGTFASCLVTGRSTFALEDWHASLFPEAGDPISSELIVGFDSGQPHEETGVAVIPFKDILSFGTVEQKMEVLVRISKQFRPSLGPALKMALNDGSNAIRVQAGTIMAKIDHDFTRRACLLEEHCAEPDVDPAVWLVLARHYDDYAHSGLVDEDRQRRLRRQALASYEKYLAQVGDDQESRVAIGRILLRSGQFEKAATWLEESIRDDHPSPQIVIWYMECLSCLSRYRELRQMAQKTFKNLQACDGFPQEVLDAVRLWACGAGTPVNPPTSAPS